MHMKKTILALAIGVAAQGVSAYETEYGNVMADIKLRYESNDTDDGVNDAGKGLITDAAIGFETKAYSGFKALAEYEIVQPLIDDYAPENAGYDVIADPETKEWNRAQISYKNEGFGAVVGRQRIILDNARFVGNVGWRLNEVTYDAATFTYSKDALTAHFSYIDQRNFLNGTEQDQSDLLFNFGYQTAIGKFVAFAYLLESEDNGAENDTYGLSYSGNTMVNETKLIYSATYSQQVTPAYETNYFAFEGGAVVSGVTLAAGAEVLGSGETGTPGFSFPYGTNHAFNGWADKFLSTPEKGLEDKYLKAATNVAGLGLLGFYHKFDSVQDSVDLGSELDLQAVKVLNKTYTVGAKYANYSAGDVGVDTTKFWLWGQAKF
ncbi:MAG: hypothetical protein CMI00_02270 [Oceanospirillaceae bacterium]|nr:hypothetical protein [Oceanospirillaceae bacterium]|tara:strand:- start:26 stop:1159 length:1134 start_codon:yes stop_codon:yes gene_type:complete